MQPIQWEFLTKTWFEITLTLPYPYFDLGITLPWYYLILAFIWNIISIKHPLQKSWTPLYTVEIPFKHLKISLETPLNNRKTPMNHYWNIFDTQNYLRTLAKCLKFLEFQFYRHVLVLKELSLWGFCWRGVLRQFKLVKLWVDFYHCKGS